VYSLYGCVGVESAGRSSKNNGLLVDRHLPRNNKTGKVNGL